MDVCWAARSIRRGEPGQKKKKKKKERERERKEKKRKEKKKRKKKLADMKKKSVKDGRCAERGILRRACVHCVFLLCE